MGKHLIAGLTAVSLLFGCHPVLAADVQQNPTPPDGCMSTEEVITVGRDQLGQVPYLTVQMVQPTRGFLWLLVNKDNKTWTLLVSCNPDASRWKPAAVGQNYLDYRDKGI